MRLLKLLGTLIFLAIIGFLVMSCLGETIDSGNGINACEDCGEVIHECICMPLVQNPIASDFIIGNLTQTAGSVTAVIITPQTGKSTGTITIFYNGSTTLPVNVGTYSITFNVAASAGWNAAEGLDGGSLSINFINQTPNASDFDINNLIQTVGSVTAVMITPKTGKSTGLITIFYNGSTTLPTSAGTYAVTFNVAASTGWNAVTGLNGGSLGINNQNPVASDFFIGNLNQTAGSVTAVTITPQEGKSTGTITVLYNGSATQPTTVGTYTVTFNVGASTGWNAANGLNGGTLVIEALMPDSRFEYYWVNEHGSLVTTSGGSTSISAGTDLIITAQDPSYTVKQWHLNGVNTGHSNNTFTFSSDMVGNYTIGLFVEKNGKIYNTNILITVHITFSGNVSTGNYPDYREHSFTATASTLFIHFYRGTLSSNAYIYDKSYNLISTIPINSYSEASYSQTVTSGQVYYIRIVSRSVYNGYSGGTYQIAVSNSSTRP